MSRPCHGGPCADQDTDGAVAQAVCQVGADRRAMPVPRLHAARRGTRWFRRLASSTAMEAAQNRPSTANGRSRAVRPVSPCEVTSS